MLLKDSAIGSCWNRFISRLMKTRFLLLGNQIQVQVEKKRVTGQMNKLSTRILKKTQQTVILVKQVILMLMFLNGITIWIKPEAICKNMFTRDLIETRSSKQCKGLLELLFYAESVKKHLARLIKVPITTSNQPAVQEAPSSTRGEARLGREAIEEELRVLHGKETWTPALDSSKSKHPLSSHVVLKI